MAQPAHKPCLRLMGFSSPIRQHFLSLTRNDFSLLSQIRWCVVALFFSGVPIASPSLTLPVPYSMVTKSITLTDISSDSGSLWIAEIFAPVISVAQYGQPSIVTPTRPYSLVRLIMPEREAILANNRAMKYSPNPNKANRSCT